MTPPTRGASSVLIIAVLVLLGGLSTSVVSLVSSVNNGYAMEITLMRAGQAAESGLDWGRYRLLRNGAPCVDNTAQNIVMPGSLEPYTVTLRCTTGEAQSPGQNPPQMQYRLTATACNVPMAGLCPNTNPTPGADYVERRSTTIVER
ncbi:MAG: hypothetical protein V4739_00395 [Pseudomonadota bacterium]